MLSIGLNYARTDDSKNVKCDLYFLVSHLRELTFCEL